MRYEISDLPEHRNTPTIVLRILRVLRHLQFNGPSEVQAPFLEAGALLPFVNENREIGVWTLPTAGTYRAADFLAAMPVADEFADGAWDGGADVLTIEREISRGKGWARTKANATAGRVPRRNKSRLKGSLRAR